MPAIPQLPLSITETSGVSVCAFPAEVDVTNAGAIRDQLLRLLDDGAGPLILDLSATRFCDCAGVGAIMRVRRRAAERRMRLCVVLPSGGAVRRIAVMTGLTRRLPSAGSLSAAHRALGTRAVLG
ncbi:STAS domain-containing protein [Actinomadura sp. DC4]|uniref:STAS domain-containing protein n=1 Tax=Actinomadura sp. DC4 TaxID=3055069 RepID=UPI0025B1D007|nr:STAS domain-containing protein [Actinomadura sp. DC4]MDN3357832.1 STAS domain-containing protein [Actinomadura sp. DC4]